MFISVPARFGQVWQNLDVLLLNCAFAQLCFSFEFTMADLQGHWRLAKIQHACRKLTQTPRIFELHSHERNAISVLGLQRRSLNFGFHKLGEGHRKRRAEG